MLGQALKQIIRLYVDNNKKYISVPHYTACNCNIEYRNSKDLSCTPRGKELIDLCVLHLTYIY